MKKLIVALLVLLAVSAFAVVETWEFEAVADTYTVYYSVDGVVQDATYENFGGEDELELYRWEHYQVIRENILLNFDLSTLDDSVEYTSLSLSMFLSDAWVLYGMDLIELSTITEPWGEYTATGADGPAHSYPPLGIYGSTWRESDIGSYVSADLDPAHISHLLDDACYGIYLWHGFPDVDSWTFASRETSNPPKLIVEYEDEAPFVAEQNPPDGATDVPLSYHSFTFHVYDEHSGVDTATIDFTVTSSDPMRSTGGETISASSPAVSIAQQDSNGVITGTLNIDDTDPKDVICSFTPSDDLPADSTITCTVAAGLADVFGNATDSDIVWSFETVDDSTIEETTWGQIKASY